MTENPENQILEDRIIELETRLAYMEASQEDLNTIIIGQQKALDQQQESLKKLREKMLALEENLPGGDEMPAHDPPPHY